MMVPLEEADDAAQIGRQRFQVGTGASNKIGVQGSHLTHAVVLAPVPKELFGHHFKARTLQNCAGIKFVVRPSKTVIFGESAQMLESRSPHQRIGVTEAIL